VREQKPAARILIADDHQLLAVTTTRQGYRTTSLQVGSPSGMPHHHGHKGRDAGMLDRALHGGSISCCPSTGPLAGVSNHEI
jgi:hypothetical protein